MTQQAAERIFDKVLEQKERFAVITQDSVVKTQESYTMGCTKMCQIS